jgi:hypothetical protein
MVDHTMKHLLVILFAVTWVARLGAQEQSVMIKEPAGQCYQDLKANLPEAIRWDDEQMMVTSRPLATTLSGNVEVIVRIFPEHGQDKKTNQRVEMCKIVVYMSAPPQNSLALNSAYSDRLRRLANLLGARVEAARKAREKKSHQERPS